MSPKARTELQRDYAQAQRHLTFLERCAAQSPGALHPILLIVTPGMLTAARQKVAALERRVQDTAAQLALFT
jgi:hypothetical protein